MPSAPFSVDVEPVRPGVAAVVVEGEIDVGTAPEFSRALASAARRNDALALIVDLSAVTFIDSSGLQALVRAFDPQRQLSGGLVVVSGDPKLATLLEITRLDRAIRVHPTRADALSALWGDA